MALCVTSVDEASPAQALGLGAGCTLLAIDGHALCDALDYQFYTTPARFALELCQDGQRRTLQVEKGEYEPFGCNFQTYLGDEKHSCANHCMFCFIDQLPPGMREPLYFKDDDERLSFLFGNYITLTNLTDREIDRILEMHISPIFVSVHTTNPELRVRMLANRLELGEATVARGCWPTSAAAKRCNTCPNWRQAVSNSTASWCSAAASTTAPSCAARWTTCWRCARRWAASRSCRPV